VVWRHGGERGQGAGDAGISRRISAQVRPLTGHAQVSLVALGYDPAVFKLVVGSSVTEWLIGNTNDF